MSERSKPSTQNSPSNPVEHLQNAGLGDVMGMGEIWMETFSEMGAEVVSFVAERIKEDVKTQQDLLSCKTVEDMAHVQAQFVQKAVDQYQEETGKLVEISRQLTERRDD